MRFEGTNTYVATPDLMLAVNAAITLQRPLLIKGEPGTGKTMLAEEVAGALGVPLLQWHIKSTTKAQQGLYEYDAVSRLRDSQLGDEKVKDISNYIVKGVLWQAFEQGKPSVILIDEVDKAVIITSNNEKELPDAFLRRCFFHYIKFPDKETMARIVDVHFPNLKKDLLREAMEVFFELREVPGMKKKPSTSELIDWLKLLVAEDIPPEALHSKDRKAVVPPLAGALLKNEQDVHLFERLVFMARHNR
jgi:MoxR-like ATPase